MIVVASNVCVEVTVSEPVEPGTELLQGQLAVSPMIAQSTSILTLSVCLSLK